MYSGDCFGLTSLFYNFTTAFLERITQSAATILSLPSSRSSVWVRQVYVSAISYAVLLGKMG